MSDASTDTRAHIRSDFERDLRYLEFQLGWPSAVQRNNDRGFLNIVWRWSDETAMTLTLDASNAQTFRIRTHLGR